VSSTVIVFLVLKKEFLQAWRMYRESSIWLIKTGERRRVKDLEYIIYFVINFESSTVANEVIKRNTDLLAPGHPIRGASAGQCSRACAWRTQLPRTHPSRSGGRMGLRMRRDHPSPLHFTCPHARISTASPAGVRGDPWRHSSSSMCFPEIYFWNIKMKHLQHISETDKTFETCVYSHINMCNTISTFKTSRWNICNIRLKQMKHLKHACIAIVTCATLRSTFETSRWNISQHTSKTLETCVFCSLQHVQHFDLLLQHRYTYEILETYVCNMLFQRKHLLVPSQMEGRRRMEVTGVLAGNAELGSSV
jgi:hypothetical protein